MVVISLTRLGLRLGPFVFVRGGGGGSGGPGGKEERYPAVFSGTDADIEICISLAWLG